MKNHWLNKKKDKQLDAAVEAAFSEFEQTLKAEDVRLARQLEAEGVEGVCEYNEMADVEPSLSIEVKASSLPDAYNEITIGDGWCDVPPITVTDCGAFCISGSPSPPLDPAISSITISNDWNSFDPGQTALSELDMEIGDGSIKYVRETTIGIFTFKDEGVLGVDIFVDGKKVGWLNSKGEKALKQWLNDKPTDICTTTIGDNSYYVGIDPAYGVDNSQTYVFRKEVYPDYKRYDYNIETVSNEVIKVPHAGKYNVYQLKNKNIVPGSVLLTTFINGVAVQSENLTNFGVLTDKNYHYAERTAMSGAKIDYSTGIVTINWINFSLTDNRYLSVCYEYKQYEESKLKERWPKIC